MINATVPEISLVFANRAIGTIITLLSWGWMEWLIHDEEALLIEQFGERYRTYRQRTRKLIPFLY